MIDETPVLSPKSNRYFIKNHSGGYSTACSLSDNRPRSGTTSPRRYKRTFGYLLENPHYTEFYSAKSSASTITNSTSFVNKLILTTGDIPLGLYRIEIEFLATTDAMGRKMYLQITENDSEIYFSPIIPGSDINSGNGIKSSIIFTRKLLNGRYEYKLNYKAYHGEASIAKAKMLFYRIC